MISGILIIKLVANAPTLSPRRPAIKSNVDKEGNNHFADISTKTRMRCTARKPKKDMQTSILLFPLQRYYQELKLQRERLEPLDLILHINFGFYHLSILRL